MSLTPEEREAIRISRELIAGGIPVFAAAPALDAAGNWDPNGGTGGCGYHLPSNWQKTVPTDKWLNPNAPGFENKAWRPGWALGAVMGHGLDLLDVDPRNGGDRTRDGLLQAGMWPRVYGAATTPSGGTHEFIATLNVRSLDGVRPGLDVKAGNEDGLGRGFAWIAPTVKASKVTGELIAYRWTSSPDLDALTDGDDDSGEAIAQMVREAKSGNSSTSSASSAAGTDPFADANERKHAGPIPDGQRHALLTSYAGWLRHKGMPQEEAEVLMKHRWKDVAQPQPGSTGRSSPTPLAYPDARTPLPLQEALDKLDDVYKRYSAGDADAESAGKAPGGALEGAEADEVQPGTSWSPLPLAAVVEGLVSGTTSRLGPTVGALTGGSALFYAGKVNGIAGASGSGKTWTALVACAQELAADHDVVYIDLEDDAEGVVGRMLDLGADPKVLLARFHYVRPDEGFKGAARQRLTELLDQHTPTLVVIDSTGEALALDGAKPNDDDDVARWFRALPAAVARRGAAVLVLDHIPKADDAAQGPIGSQRKRAAISGAQYMQNVRKGQGFAKGAPGSAVLTCSKDRHGTYRQGEQVATLRVEPLSEGVSIALESMKQPTAKAPDAWRPTQLMERVSEHLELAGQPLSRSAITKEVTGNKEQLLKALDVLSDEGFITTGPGPRGAVLCSLVNDYRQSSDPFSDRYVEPQERVDPFDPSPQPSTRPVPRSSRKEEERENGSGAVVGPVLGTGEERVRNGSAHSQIGPCVRCTKPTRRYGNDAAPVCASCELKAAGA